LQERKKKGSRKKKIERSRKATEARIQKMRERDMIIKQLREEVVLKLVEVSRNPRYADLIRFLIVQGLMTIAEHRVILQCRQEDLQIVRAQVDAAVKLYQDSVRQATGVVPKCQIDLSNEYLPPAPRPGQPGLSCCGGVVLSACNGTIVCRNTLDSRLDLCFDSLIPQIRGLLFGVRPKAVGVPSPVDQHK